MKILHGNIGDENDYVSEQYLEINNAGVSNWSHGDYTVIREHGRKDYQITYLKSGKMTALVDDKTVKIGGGKVLIHHPNDTHKYSYLQKDKYESLWLQFSGKGSNEILESLGLSDKRLISVSRSEELEFLFSRIVSEHKLKHRGYKTQETALLLEILCYISRNDSEQFSAKEIFSNQKIENILVNMERDVTKNKSVEDYAEMMNLSVSRFSHVFTEAVGVSPHRYILNLKINKSKQMLRQTDMNVCEVGRYVGFNDALYFSRIFKKLTGETPKKYKASHGKII